MSFQWKLLQKSPILASNNQTNLISRILIKKKNMNEKWMEREVSFAKKSYFKKFNFLILIDHKSLIFILDI